MWKLKAALLLALVPAVSGLVNCNLDNPTPPELAGPSELAISIEMRANPDQLTADGFSSSVIEAVVRNASGARVGAGAQTVIFDITLPGTALLSGTFFDLGNIAPLDSPRPLPGGEEARQLSVATDGSGVARARYWAPFRTDQENDTTVTITGRPAGTDVRGVVLRQVDIFLRAANRPSFPGGTTCVITWEPVKSGYRVGEQVFLSALQVSGIARYEWEIEDPLGVLTYNEGRGTEINFDLAGDYTARLSQTSTSGALSANCATQTFTAN